MAARNPSAFTTWIDEDLLAAGRKIVETQPDNIWNDLQFFRDAKQMVVSDAFWFQRTNSGSMQEFARYKIEPKNRGVGTGTLSWSVRAKIDGTAVGEFQIVSPTTTTTLSGVTDSTPIWQALTGSHTEDMDDTAIDFVLSARVTSGTGFVYCHGILIRADAD